MISKHRFIIDTDCGFDDLTAVLMFLHENFPLEMITTVNGMTSPAEGAASMRGLVNSLGKKHIPVVSGISKSSEGGRPVKDVDWYGEYLLNLRKVTKKFAISSPEDAREDAPHVLIEKVRESDFKLICLGPLTNIARCIEMSSTFVTDVNELILMGGAVYENGNMPVDDTTSSELNFWVDSKAASAVISAGFKKITILPLDGCNPLKSYSLKNLPFRKKNKELIFHDLLEYSDGSAVQYDSLVVFYLKMPSSFTLKNCKIDIDPKTGVSIESQNGTEVNLLMNVQPEKYYRYIISVLFPWFSPWLFFGCFLLFSIALFK